MIKKQRRFVWKLFWYFLVMIVVPLFIIGWYSQVAFRHHYLSDKVEQLSSQSYLLSMQLGRLQGESIDSLCKITGDRIKTRITVIRKDGEVLGDSQNDPDTMENHLTRPEVAEALKGGRGISERYSTTLQSSLLYFAKQFTLADNSSGVIRLALPVRSIRDAESKFYRGIALVAIVLICIAILLTYLISRRISRPLETMKKAAQGLASGDLKLRLDETGSEEEKQLSKSINEMANQLRSRIQAIISQHNEQSAILKGMVEGVIAVDKNGKIILTNDAAASLFDLDRDAVKGKWIHEAIRNSELQKFLSFAGESEPVMENIIKFNSHDQELYLQVHGTRLCDAGGGKMGALIVLNDITKIRKLENIRKEFVANVSHELRTPLTAIKGFVETLILETKSGDEQSKHFLSIISNKVDRLCYIIDDLLSLAKIDKETEKREMKFECVALREILSAAASSCAAVSAEKSVNVKIECAEDLVFQLNAVMMEQAVTNLIDNAVKYSEAGQKVNVCAEAGESELVISVVDQGIGISKEHLPRLFERFYRVDKARSNKLGGTGLGLSIVKNIAVAHNGTVSVDSEPGKGSTFRIHIPKVNGIPTVFCGKSENPEKK